MWGWALVGAALAKDTVELPVVATFVEGTYDEKAGTADGWVDRGWKDGVLADSRGVRVFRRLDDGSVVLIGTADVVDRKKYETKLFVRLEKGVQPQLGDTARLPASWTTVKVPLAWDLAREDIRLLDAKDENVIPWKRLRKDPFAVPDDELCAEVAEAARAETWEGWDVDTPLDRGRFAGRTIRQVAAEATPEQACAGLMSTIESSESAHGNWSLGGVFGAWVSSGAPLSFRELEHAAATLDDEAFAALVLTHRAEDGWPTRLHGEIFEALEREEPDRARALLALLERWDRFDDEPWTTFWVQMARGEFPYIEGDGHAAADAWMLAQALEPEPSAWTQGKLGRAWKAAGEPEASDEAWRVAHAMGDPGLRNWEEYADLMKDMERWPEAAEGYRRCLDGWKGQARDEQPKRMVWCSMGLGEALNEQGLRYDAWEAWLVAYEISAARGWNLWEAKAEEAFGEMSWDLSLYEKSATNYDDAVAARRRGDPDTPEIADALDRAALSWWEAGRRDLAFDRLTQAIDLYRRLDRPTDLAWAIRKLGMFEKELGDPAAAIALYREALATFPADAYAARSRLTQDIASVLYAQGRNADGDAALAEAQQLAERSGDTLEMAIVADTRAVQYRTLEASAAAAEAWRRHGDPASTAAALDALARLQMDSAPPEVVEATLADARRLAESGEYQSIQGRLLVTEAWWTYQRGDAASAAQLAQTGLDTMGKFATPHSTIDAVMLLALLDSELGEREKALERIDGLLADTLDPSKPNLRRLRADVLAGRAQALMALGRYEEATAEATEARRLAEEHGALLSEVSTLLLLADLQELRGQLGASWRSTQRAAAIQEVALPAAGAADLQLASMAPMVGRAEEAIAACDRALAVLPAESVHQRSEALERRGLAKRALGDLRGASDDLAAALDVPGIGGPQRMDIAVDLADVQVLLGDAQGALATLDALPGYETDPIGAPVGFAVRARALADLGRPREAVAAGERAVQAADAVRIPTLQAFAHSALALARRAQGDLPGAIAEGRIAIGLADQLHASIGDDDAVKRLRAGPDGDAWEHLAVALEASGRPEEARQVREARGAAPARPTQVVTDFEDYAETLEIEVPDLPDRIAVPTNRFASLQQDLREDEALLVPVVLPGRVVVFVVRASGDPTWTEVPVAEDRVAALVADMRSALQAPDRAWKATRGVKVVQVQQTGDPTAAARELEKLVIAPVREQLAGVTTLVVAPGGRLRYVPFAALTDGERYLVEDYQLALLTASGTATTHREIDPRGGVFALSNPDGSLPGASAEVVALQKTWGKRATAFDGAAATEEVLRSGVAGAGIVHLATHGVLDNERPRESYLLMAGEEARLTLAEISLLPLQDVDLVVLSACETAVGEHGEGKEIAGLAYQFEVRGAASVIASLWAVDDASTSDLMVDLYGGLRKREARAEALREAQLALLSDPDTAHPYYWAPFILIGDWR